MSSRLIFRLAIYATLAGGAYLLLQKGQPTDAVQAADPAGGGWAPSAGILLALGAVLALIALMRRQGANVQAVLPAELNEWMRAGKDLVVVDVRTEEEYRGPLGHIKGARLIPIQDLRNRLGELEKAREKTLVLVCRTDRRSRMGVQVLNAAGFSDVFMLRTGMTGWAESGLPTSKK